MGRSSPASASCCESSDASIGLYHFRAPIFWRADGLRDETGMIQRVLLQHNPPRARTRGITKRLNNVFLLRRGNVYNTVNLCSLTVTRTRQHTIASCRAPDVQKPQAQRGAVSWEATSARRCPCADCGTRYVSCWLLRATCVLEILRVVGPLLFHPVGSECSALSGPDTQNSPDAHGIPGHGPHSDAHSVAHTRAQERGPAT